MGFITPFAAGHILTAADLASISNEAGGLFALKAGTLSRTTSTLANDPDLQVTCAANATYTVELIVAYTFGAGGMKIDWSILADMNWRWALNSLDNSVTSSSGIIDLSWRAASTPQVGGLSGGNSTLLCTGLLQTVSAGNFGFRWAQQTTNAAATSVIHGSLTLTRRQ